MLDRMRAFATTWPARILIGVLIVGLSVWGISNVFVNLGSTTVASVGDQEISTREFQRAYVAQTNALSQRTGRAITVEESIAQGIPSIVLQQLAVAKALDGLAADFGMGASEQQIADMVAADSSFAGILGEFNRDRFYELLRQNGWTEAEYLDTQAGAVRRQQIASAMFRGVPVPKTMQEIAGRFQSDTRTVEFFTVNTTNIDAVPAPTETELQAFLTERQAQYRTTETRTVRVLVLTPPVYARTIEVTDAELRSEYERTAAQYFTDATRTIQVLTLPVAASVSWFNLGLSRGKSFEALLAETGLADAVVELGTQTRAAISDQALAEAAFSLDAGEYAVLGDAGAPRVVHVTAADPGGRQSFETVIEQVREKLTLARATETMSDAIDKIEELRAALTPIDAIAARFGFQTAEVTTDAAGIGLDTLSDLPEPARATLAQAAFAAAPNRLIPSIPIGASSTVWFDLIGSDPARDLTLAEARDQVLADWDTEKTDAALAARAAELAERIRGGEPLVDVAAELGVFSQISVPIGRNGDGVSIGPAVARLAFNGGLGHVAAARNAEGEYLVFQVTDIQSGQSGGNLDQNLDQALSDGMSQSVFGQFVAALQVDKGLRVNQQVLQKLLTTAFGTQ